MTQSNPRYPDADSTPNDFGPPDKLYYKYSTPMTKEEEAEYFDKLEEMQNDL